MDATPATEYRALNMLVQDPPKVRNKLPFWRPAPARPHKEVFLPNWTWARHDFRDHDPAELVSMDVNGAYLAAASSAVFAHGGLIHAFPPAVTAPGYYLTDAHPWHHDAIVSPLGTGQLPGERVWVMHPTMILLRELVESGHWPDAPIHDAWHATETCRMSKWTTAVQRDRTIAREAVAAGVPGARAEYKAIKDGYSIAVQMMKGPAPDKKTKSPVFRPDWYATIHAQHAASTWRKLFASVQAGHGPVAMGATDAATWTADDIAALQFRSKPVFRIDPTGIRLGAFKFRSDDE